MSVDFWINLLELYVCCAMCEIFLTVRGATETITNGLGLT